MKKLKIITSIALICLVLLMIFFPYLKAEYLTMRYGDEFIGLEQQTGMLNSPTYHKVVEYSDTQATVCYVESGTCGNIITFQKKNNSWNLLTWKTVWSHYGSADEFYWPYYR